MAREFACIKFWCLYVVCRLGEKLYGYREFSHQKKGSLRLLQQEKKIPRSLRIKCELTTSPSYANNPVFLKLKTNLQQKVSIFITEGARIMTEWTSMNVQLLTTDRCSNILTKALQILDGLTSFHIDVLGNPIWPSVEDNNIPLFLLKFYFYSKYFNTEELSIYLDTPPEDILLIGAKIWLNNQSEDNANKLLESFKLNDNSFWLNLALKVYAKFNLDNHLIN